MLKIDLLPKHFAIARTNKRILTIGIVLLVLVGGGFWLKHKAIRAEIAKVQEAIAEVKPTADEVDELQAQISEKQGWLDPIKSKLDFVEKADKTGDKYFDCFHSINKYIWQGAQMSSFSITDGSSVQFTVQVRGDAGVGRFLLNLLRCPDLTNITYSGVPGGQSIETSGAGVATAGAVPGPPGMGMMRPGGMPPSVPGPQMQEPGAPPMPPPEMMGPGGMPPGMPGPAGLPQAATASRAAGVEPGSPNEPITLQISATLTEPITVPTPPGQAAAAVGMGGGMGPGMMGPPVPSMGVGGPLPAPGSQMGRPAGPSAPLGGTAPEELSEEELEE